MEQADKPDATAAIAPADAAAAAGTLVGGTPNDDTPGVWCAWDLGDLAYGSSEVDFPMRSQKSDEGSAAIDTIHTLLPATRRRLL